MVTKETTTTEETTKATTTTPTTTTRGDMDSDYILLPDGRKAEVIEEIQGKRGTPRRRGYTSSDRFPWPQDFHSPSREHRASREEIAPMFNHIHDILKDRGIERKQFAGSIRRGCKTIGDIDMVVSSPKQAEGAQSGGIFYEGFDFWVSEPHYWGAMLLEASGSWKFNVWLRTVAKARGLKLNRYGLWKRDESLDGPWKLDGNIKPIFSKTETHIFQGLNMRFIPPKDRCIRNKDTKLWEGC